MRREMEGGFNLKQTLAIMPSSSTGSSSDEQKSGDEDGIQSMKNSFDQHPSNFAGCSKETMTDTHCEVSNINTTATDIRNLQASHTDAATRETTAEIKELSNASEQCTRNSADQEVKAPAADEVPSKDAKMPCIETLVKNKDDYSSDNHDESSDKLNNSSGTTVHEVGSCSVDRMEPAPSNDTAQMPQSAINNLTMDESYRGALYSSNKLDESKNNDADKRSARIIGRRGKPKSSGVAPLPNDVDQNLVVDEDQFRMLAISPSPRDESLEEGKLEGGRSFNIASSSPIDVVSFASSDGAMLPESATGNSSPSRKKFKRRGSDNLSASSPADAILRRRDRCYFTIVIPKATHGQAEEMELSEIGTEELDDPERKRALSDGEDFIPNSVENGSAVNEGSVRSRGQATDDPSLTPYMASADSKFEVYAVAVDRKQDDKASEIALCSIERPHMRGFHFAWLSMFIAFLMWFSITALLSEIQISLNLTKEEIWTSSVFGTTGTIIMRVIMGPLCDKYGSRLCMSLVLLTSSIPTGLTGLVNSASGLYINRLCVGIAGASFVTCEYWTSSLFIKEIAGTANSLVSGWGNLGGGVTQIMMGSVIFPILKIAYGGDSPEAANAAWRIAFIFPATIGFVMGSLCWRYSDDCPKGNYIKREKQNLRVPVSAFLSLTSACWEPNTWIFVVQYACCFGVEFAMNNAAPLYFRERFDLTTEASAAVASIFGFLNLFARGMGGFVSDVCNARYGMRGRLLWMFAILLLQGSSIIIFGFAHSLGGAITVMVVFSLFVQAAEGSVYAIVPYVNPSATGSISGIVGAGGTVGGAVFAVLFREYSWEAAFAIMGATVAASSFLSFFLRIRGFEHTYYFCRPKNANRVSDRSPDTVETNLEHLEQDDHQLTSDVDFDHL